MSFWSWLASISGPSDTSTGSNPLGLGGSNTTPELKPSGSALTAPGDEATSKAGAEASNPATSLFSQALAFTLSEEGGKVDDPTDRGGRTNMGITQRTYDRWVKMPGFDVFDITPQIASSIYRAYYWLPGDCDSLPGALGIAHFDSCVLFGVDGARKFLRSANVHDYIDLRRSAHLMDVKRNPAQSKFLNGWLGRCDRLEVFCSSFS